MPPIYGIQPTFAGGEFSPSLWSRVDLQKYSTGLRTAKNFFIHPHGGASNRPGFKYIATTKDSSKLSRLVPFEFSTEQAYILEFGHNYIRFYMNGGQIMDGGSPYEVSTTYAQTDIWNLKFTQSADTLYICHPNFKPKTLVRYGHTSWTLSDYAYTGGPFMVSNVYTAKTLYVQANTGSTTMIATGHTPFVANHVGSLWELRHYITELLTNSGTIGTTFTSASIKCGKSWRLDTTGTWNGVMELQTSIDNGSTWNNLRVFNSNSNFNISASGTTDSPILIRLNVPTWLSGTAKYSISSEPYTHIGIVQVTGYTSSTQVTVSVLQTVGKDSATYGTTLAKTADWAEGSWSVVRGYPRCATFYQDRLCFASTVTEPQTTWMTETGVYTSFARSEPLIDSDGITVNLPSRKMNSVVNLVNLGDILAFTSSSEWSIGPAGDGVISPTSVSQKLHGYRGSSGVDPVFIGNKVIFVQPLGSIVHDLGYDFQSNGYTGSNITVTSNHFFKGYQIVDMCYQQEPDSIVWCIRDDGKLLSLTYQPEQEVYAWTKHETDGEFESVATIPGNTYDEVWVIVNRANGRFVELLTERMTSTDPFNQFFVDSGIILSPTKQSISNVTSQSYLTKNYVKIHKTAHGLSVDSLVDLYDLDGMSFDKQQYKVGYVTGTPNADFFNIKDGDNFVEWGTSDVYPGGGAYAVPTTSISGLSHLNGQTVAILGNGDVLTPEVVSAGTITLDEAVSTAYVGLPYTCDLETLNVELSLQDGTLQGRKSHIAQVTMRFIDSRGGWIGPDSDTLHEIVQRTNEPLGSPIALFSGDVSENIAASFDSGGRIFYRQVDPLPVTVLSFMPVIEVGG